MFSNENKTIFIENYQIFLMLYFLKQLKLGLHLLTAEKAGFTAYGTSDKLSIILLISLLHITKIENTPWNVNTDSYF